MLDVGVCSPTIPESFSGSYSETFPGNEKLFEHIIGNNFQSLYNITAKHKRNLKLKAPYTSYIADKVEALTPVIARNFHGNLSLARGGLANAWGAGAYRFTDQDLADFPINYNDLEDYYDKLTAHIGISGQNDDLTPWFHQDNGLQPPIRVGRLAQTLLDRYQAKRNYFNTQGLFIGKGRLAVLTRKHNGRTPYTYDGMEFFRSDSSGVYTPIHTLNALEKEETIRYKGGILVKSFKRESDHVLVEGVEVESHRTKSWRCRKLLLGAGAINSARLVLYSNNDSQSRLSLLDNPLSGFPLFNLSMLGTSRDTYNASVAQLNFIYQNIPSIGTMQVSFYGANGPLRADILGELPLPRPAARQFLKYCQNSFGITMCFYPGVRRAESYVRLRDGNTLEIAMEQKQTGKMERQLMGMMRKIGYYSHPSLATQPLMGSGLHFAGTLPMMENPKDYECDPMGKLSGGDGVYVIDGSSLSALPAKNHTLTIMANAMRIANGAIGNI